jgi:hypothetical protein
MNQHNSTQFGLVGARMCPHGICSSPLVPPQVLPQYTSDTHIHMYRQAGTIPRYKYAPSVRNMYLFTISYQIKCIRYPLVLILFVLHEKM